ncbi:hypothetical protein [Lutibacter flavus]|uniref:Uncharacterized protein n=1 Tax=Lutibacter flavus TaxID=691689 RepID=A0A238VD80_9FLAO|nr:hypothetical protein [Lutibacter flavus]SNR32370.1 hypothetical protein SAMN04488111_0322 [Lutibacter flavus]
MIYQFEWENWFKDVVKKEIGINYKEIWLPFKWFFILMPIRNNHFLNIAK